MDAAEITPLGGRQSRQDQVLRHLRGKETDWASMADRGQPLGLLDLPIDILQVVIKEVPHTNDLISLALTHSALHALVIPHIYSRFDIVWPDSNPLVENHSGVDALTYGLGTLVMAHDVFGEVPTTRTTGHPAQRCNHCGKFNRCYHTTKPTRTRRSRRGNHFAQYTRKFSLGNGPREWVQDYAITKESGKMLGTLIALAVGRMRNLEAFIFDMPTGVLRDVWLALASQADRDDGEGCRLDQVWVRWHDNSDQATLSSNAIPTLLQPSHASGISSVPSSHSPLFQIPAYPRVQFPTFSILPPLRSLSVLDIDELSYAEEMSVLIEISVEKLKELRVGVAQHAQIYPWVRPAEDRRRVDLPIGTTTDQVSRPGGILGILSARVQTVYGSPLTHASELDGTAPLENTAFELDDKPITTGSIFNDNSAVSSHMHSTVATAMSDQGGDVREDDEVLDEQTSEIDQLSETLAEQHLQDDSTNTSGQPGDQGAQDTNAASACTSKIPDQQGSDVFADTNLRSRMGKKLKLEVLELERVPLSVPVLSKALDWSRLVTLTLLGCRNHEQLWKALRKRFAPSSYSRNSSFPLKTPTAKPSSAFLTPTQHLPSTPKFTPIPTSSYALQIRHIHTDAVSPALLSFIHTTLAPDTITHLFLQASPTYKTPVTISQIYKLAIRRHRASLRKLLIDSFLRPTTEPDTDAEYPDSTDASHLAWLYSRDLLAAITSPKMHLRELALSIAYRDWQFFLQRLPAAKELRSLHILRIAEQPPRQHGRRSAHLVDPPEVALQLLDIVALRPEVELCYLGIANKCFEVLECDDVSGKKGKGIESGPFVSGVLAADGAGNGDENDGSDEEGGEGNVAQGAHSDEDDESDLEIESVTGTDTTTDDEGSQSDGKKKVVKTFKLREILFYDDKVSIFKARHGKL